MVYDGSNAFEAGIAAGDVVIATSASIGAGMWPKTTVSGVEAAISTRLDGNVRLRLMRPERARRTLPWEAPLLHTYEVELRQPLGMVLSESGAVGPAAGAVVDAVALGGSAAASGVVRAGDLVVATSGTIGDALWEKSSLEGINAAISTRLAISPTVTLRICREQHLGAWAGELYAISLGKRDRLSRDALSSLRTQRRQLRNGTIVGDAVFDALRALTVASLKRTPNPTLLRGVLRRTASCGLAHDPRLTSVGMGASLRAGVPAVAIDFFDRLYADGGRANVQVYTILIKAHAAAGRIAEALAVEQRMAAEQVDANVRTYNTLMSVCAKAGDRKAMLAYFGSMSERGVRPTTASWNVVIDYCARHMRGSSGAKQIVDVIARMRTQGLQPDLVSYTCLAKAYVASGETEKCDGMEEQMAEDAVQADTRWLNTVLDGYARQLQWGRALALLKRHRSGQGVRPDADSYVHVLRACVGARVPSKAALVVRLMRRARLPISVQVYSMLLSAYAKAGRLRPSLATLRVMRAEGVRPNRFVYGSLIEACVVARQPKTAVDLFEQMREQGIKSDTVSYTLLLRAALAAPAAAITGPSQGGTSVAGAGGGVGGAGVGGAGVGASISVGPRRAHEILQTMRSSSGGCLPTAVTYNHLIGGCIAHGATELAIKAVDAMLADRISPTMGTFLALTTPIGSSSQDPLGEREGSPPPPSVAEAAAHLAFLKRVVRLFAERKQRLHGDVYVPSLRAAQLAGDHVEARELVYLRRERGLFPLRRSQEREVAELEAAVEALAPAKGATD
jgi:pentatricopeptide repeat protein